MITCRRTLPHLDGVHLALAPLCAADAVDLFTRVVGADRVVGPDRAAGPAATAVVELCDRLPLAVRLAAGRLVRRPDWSVADLAARLRPEAGRLDELRFDGCGVREWYAEVCRGPAAAVLARLGTLRAPEYRIETVAAVLGVDVRAAEAALEPLIDDRLVEARPGGRYALPGLVRAYARELARSRAGQGKGAGAGAA